MYILFEEHTTQVAIAALSEDIPSNMIDSLQQSQLELVAHASTPKRKRELLWSRGLLNDLYSKRNTSGFAQADAGQLNHSISHDSIYTVVCLAPCSKAGVDVQSARPIESCYRIARAWFPAEETKEIIDSNNSSRFLQSWVIKEAWAKCNNKSIFEACSAVQVSNDTVHLNYPCADILRFAWTWISSEEQTSGCAIGLCLKDHKTTPAPCVINFSHTALENLEMQPIPVHALKP